MYTIPTIIGVDLAKNVFSVCEMDSTGRVLRRQDLKRDAFATWLGQHRRARWWRWKHAAARITGGDAAWNTVLCRA